MNLKGNPINEWSSINNLATLDRLQTLFVTSANFEGLNGLDVREMIIAKLSKLTMLNRGDISAIERRSAELCKCNGLEEALKAPHENDIKRLIQIHGEPIADKNKAKKINVVKVSISYQGKSLLRPLPTSSTVSKVTEIAARLFALDPKVVTLWIEPKEGVASELSIPARQLSFYSVGFQSPQQQQNSFMSYGQSVQRPY
ncbi:unnamed protein product, partial [Mesorhabditis belari]|uniref:Uncharacterized protein n=1 Tax=Mesorhabditis belari TaxID=2138241 RepID=A0AAF3EXN7_9BILA